MKTEDIIALMSLYRDEWKFRDEVFRQNFWRLVYLSLVIAFLPNFLESVSFKDAFVLEIPKWIFAAAGILCCLFGLYVGHVENDRIKKIDLAYRELEKALPAAYQVEKNETAIMKLRINNVFHISIYTVLILVAIIKICYEAYQ